MIPPPPPSGTFKVGEGLKVVRIDYPFNPKGFPFAWLSLIFRVGGEMKKAAGEQTFTGVTVNAKGLGRGIRVLGNNTNQNFPNKCLF